MFENGKMWADDVGKPIQAHGGCIIQHDGMWYWYGEHKGAKNCPGTTVWMSSVSAAIRPKT